TGTATGAASADAAASRPASADAATATGAVAASSAPAACADRAPAGGTTGAVTADESGRPIWPAQGAGRLSLASRPQDRPASLLSKELARKQRGGPGRDARHHRPRRPAARRHDQPVERL